MNRKLLLQELIAVRFSGNQADFARAIHRSPAQVNQWLSGHRRIGDAGARTIEMALNLEAGYFDRQVSYAKAGNIRALQLNEPAPQHDIDEVVAMMRATDDKGRAMVLGAVRAVLAGHTPAVKNLRS